MASTVAAGKEGLARWNLAIGQGSSGLCNSTLRGGSRGELHVDVFGGHIQQDGY
jgi:hypothetical protein